MRAIVFLAGYQSGYLSRTEIAKATLVPHDYLLKVLNQLDSAGIVESRRGPGGGYRLTSPPERITALDVVLAVDSIPRIKECPLGFSSHVKLCPLHTLLDDASRLVGEAFQGATVASLVPERRPKQACDFTKTKNQN